MGQSSVWLSRLGLETSQQENYFYFTVDFSLHHRIHHLPFEMVDIYDGVLILVL